MPAELTLVITLRKVVPDQDAADALRDVIAGKIESLPSVKMTAHTTLHYPQTATPE